MASGIVSAAAVVIERRVGSFAAAYVFVSTCGRCLGA